MRPIARRLQRQHSEALHAQGKQAAAAGAPGRLLNLMRYLAEHPLCGVCHRALSTEVAAAGAHHTWDRLLAGCRTCFDDLDPVIPIVWTSEVLTR